MKTILIAALLALACLSFAANTTLSSNYAAFVPANASYSIVSFTTQGADAYAVVSNGEIYAIFTSGMLGMEPVTDTSTIQTALHDYYVSIGLSPDAAGRFAEVHDGIRNISGIYQSGTKECRILTGTDTHPCTDFDSCQKACYSVTSFCEPVALGAGKAFIDSIWQFENDTSALDEAYAEENSFYSLFSANETSENMDAYLLSLNRINVAATAASQNPLFSDYSYCGEPDYSLPDVTSLQLSAQELYHSASPFFTISSEAALVENRTLEGLSIEDQGSATAPPSTTPTATSTTGVSVTQNMTTPPAPLANSSSQAANSSSTAASSPASSPPWIAIGVVIGILAVIAGIGIYYFTKKSRKGL